MRNHAPSGGQRGLLPPSIGRHIYLLGHRLYRISGSHVVHEDHKVVACVTGARNEHPGALEPGDSAADKLWCRKIFPITIGDEMSQHSSAARFRRSATLANLIDSL